MKDNYSIQLSKLLGCLEDMRNSAREKDWEQLAKNEKERENIIEDLKLLSPDNSQENIELLQKVIAINKEVIEVASKNKNESEVSLLAIKRKLKKSSFYQQ